MAEYLQKVTHLHEMATMSDKKLCIFCQNLVLVILRLASGRVLNVLQFILLYMVILSSHANFVVTILGAGLVVTSIYVKNTCLNNMDLANHVQSLAHSMLIPSELM